MIEHNKRETLLAALTSYANDIRNEIERKTQELSAELSRVEQAIAALSGENGPADTDVLRPPSGGEYEGIGTQRAVEKFLRANPGRMFRPKSIAELLKASGFTVSDPRLAKQYILIALIRAVKKGVAMEGKLEGKKAFQLNPNQVSQNDIGPDTDSR
jgi:hypothetical protein